MYSLLIVDDNRFIVDGLVLLIGDEEPGLDITWAYSPHLALKEIERKAFHIALVDIMMGPVDGFEVLRKIHAFSPGCRVIFLTAYDSFEYAHRAIKFDAFGYVLKNEGEEEIVRTLRQAISSLEKEAEAAAPSALVKNGQGEDDDLVSKVNRYICENLHRGVILAAIAEHVGYHPSYLSRLYKQLAGTGIFMYINDVRLSRARELLVDNKYRVHEIGRLLGFENTSNFIRFFRKATDMTPLEYRASSRRSLDGQPSTGDLPEE